MKQRPPMTHRINTWPEYFEAVLSGDKTHEIRVRDRDYMVGDTLELIEWCNEKKAPTGREHQVVVTYIQDKARIPTLFRPIFVTTIMMFGRDIVIMSIKPKNDNGD